MDHNELKPLLVPGPVARKILGVGNTKYWELVKAGKIKLVEVGARQMAVYASLEAIAQPAAEEAAERAKLERAKAASLTAEEAEAAKPRRRRAAAALAAVQPAA